MIHPLKHLAAVILTTGALLLSGQATKDPREQASIKKIADMLTRLGEEKTALRLKKDYAKGLIIFGDLDPGSTAETGKPVSEWANKKPNKMTLNREKVFQQVADYRGTKTNPLAFDWAGTVMHEYVHMDQVNPTHTAKFETPAWIASSDALRRWLGVLHRDFERAQKLSGPAKERLLEDVDILMSQLVSTCAALDTDLKEKINNKNVLGQNAPLVDPKKNYNFRTTLVQAQALLAQVRKARGASPSPGGGTPAKTKFTWRRESGSFYLLQPEETVAEYKSRNDFSITGAEGVVTFGYRAGAETARFAVTWNRPPDRLVPGETIRITVKASDTGSSAPVGGAGGNVSVFAQRTPGGSWDLVYGNQPMVAITGRGAPDSRDYVFAVPEGRPGQILAVKVTVWDTLIGSEYMVLYICE